MKEMTLQIFNNDIAAYVLVFGFVIYPILLVFIPSKEGGDGMNKKSGLLKIFIYLIIASGLLLSLYLILFGIYSFPGWGDRIVFTNQLLEDYEGRRGRGTILLLIFIYLGPLISIIWGMIIFNWVIRFLRTGRI